MPYTYREIERRLRRLGFTIVREGRGSHVIFSNGQLTFPIPRHAGRTISIGVEKTILRLLKLTSHEFREID